MTAAPRLAELVGSLSLATDLAAGFAAETALRTCLLAVGIGRASGLAGDELRDVYYTGLLRFIGCTAFAHDEQAWYGAGDDLAFSRELAPVDAARAAQVLNTVIKRVGRGAGAVARTLADPGGPRKFAAAHRDLAVRLAARLGMRAPVVAALGHIYERWDGKGNPHEAEPSPFARIDAARVREIAEAFALFVDVKSPYTLGHSTGEARLAAAAAAAMRGCRWKSCTSPACCTILVRSACRTASGRNPARSTRWKSPSLARGSGARVHAARSRSVAAPRSRRAEVLYLLSRVSR